MRDMLLCVQWSYAAKAMQGKGGRSRGKQVYLGGWLTEEEAAVAYDKASIVYWGRNASLNVMPTYFAL